MVVSIPACGSSSGPSTGSQPTETGAAGNEFPDTGGYATGSGGTDGFQTQGSGGLQTTEGSGGYGTGGGESTGTGGAQSTGGASGAGGVRSTGGATGAGGGTSPGGSSGGGAGGAPAAKPPCITDPSQGAIIGDSYVTGAASPALQPALEALDPAATFQNYAVPGTSLASGGLLGFIPPQLTSAIGQQPNLKFMIMDGGGNDILICDQIQYPGCNTICDAPGAENQKVCTDIVAAAFTVAKQMMTTAANAGIKDVVYFFYPHIPDANGGFKDILDYAAPLAEDLCNNTYTQTNGKLTCHFVDPRAAFAAAGGDMNTANFAADGIHPSQTGQNIMAGLIWNKMKADCLDQPEGSACCE